MNNYYFQVKIFIILLIILWSIQFSLCSIEIQNSLLIRQKREPPPMFRYIKQSHRTTYSRRKPKPLYGLPPRQHYGPPKSIYFNPSSKTIYGSPPKPIYGPPPKPIYGPPPKPVYGPPSKLVFGPPPKPIYGPPPKPIYGPPPKPVYGPPPSIEFSSKPPSEFLYGPPSIELNYEPASIYDTPTPETLPKPPPPLSKENFKNTYSNDNNNQNNYEFYNSPTEHHNSNYETPSFLPYQPSNNYNFQEHHLEEHNNPLPSKYETSYQSYEIPTTHKTPLLNYDSSSASYETPGALNSYGVPINNHNEQYNQPEPIFSQTKINPIKITHNNFAPTSISHQYIHLKRKNEDNKKIESNQTNRKRNHNYDGPGIEDLISNKNIETLNENIDESQTEIEILKSHSFNYFGGKSNSLSEKIMK